MTAVLPQAALAAIEAVAIDCETTGLDARSARIIQLGAVRIRGGGLVSAGSFDQIIDPGISIPAETTAIHGLTDEAVRGQPKFDTVAVPFLDFIGKRLIIGHTIQFDIAMLHRECVLANIAWQTPRVLDVRLLGRVASPTLAAYDLDRMCSWLGVTVKGRHTAFGDALATAEVFLKLVPLLRQRGIRTLAEAEAACVELAERDARSAGGLMLPERAAATSPALSKLDSFAYRHRVSDVMSSPAEILPATATLAEATKHMISRGLSSVFVALDQEQVGIITERDALRAYSAFAADAAATLIGSIAKSPLIGVEEDDFVYRAIGRMERHGIRHLAVRRNGKEIVGALTPRNLLRNRATSSIVIGDRIAAAETPPELASIWSEVPGMVDALRWDGVSARTIAGVISAEICAITNRAADLAINEQIRAGLGEPPCAFAVLVLGSAGRGESLIAADQDNAIVFASGAPGGTEDHWFERMATRMNAILDEAGIAYCMGGVMAQNAQWRHSRQGWAELVSSWVRRQRPQDLLNVDIFFDATTVSGDRELGDNLIADAQSMARRSPDFLVMLTELARQWQSPTTMFGGFHKVDGRLDLKKHGLMPIFTGARVLALRHGVLARSTLDRLKGVVSRGVGSERGIDDILAAHELMLSRVLEQQMLDVKSGIRLSPRIDVDRLDKSEKRALKDAIEAVPLLIDLVSEGRL